MFSKKLLFILAAILLVIGGLIYFENCRMANQEIVAPEWPESFPPDGEYVLENYSLDGDMWTLEIQSQEYEVNFKYVLVSAKTVSEDEPGQKLKIFVLNEVQRATIVVPLNIPMHTFIEVEGKGFKK